MLESIVIVQLYFLKCKSNIGITHVFFHVLTFAGSRGSCLKRRPLGRVFKHRPRDSSSVNAMKQTCANVMLAYSTRVHP